MDRKTATIIMRWVIFLTLFGTVIWQSNQIDTLRQQLDEQNYLVIHQQVQVEETNQQFAALAKSCLK